MAVKLPKNLILPNPELIPEPYTRDALKKFMSEFDSVYKKIYEMLQGVLWEIDGTETQLIAADELDMQTKKIINVVDPTDAQDAATKKYVDDTSGAASLWEVDGAEHQLKTADEIDMQSKKIINVTDPVSDQDAATKKYVDDNSLWEVDGAEHQLKTADEIDMQSKKIVNVTDPVSDQDAATKKYVDDQALGENSVENIHMADSAIHQAELNTSTGSQSGSLNDNQNAEITMHDYSFFPNIYLQSAIASDVLFPVDDNTDSQIGRFSLHNTAGVGQNYDVQWRYVAASDPEPSIYVVYNKIIDKIQHIWVAKDHPFMSDPDVFPNPFTQFKNNPDYEICLIDNNIWNELKQRIGRKDRIARIILNEYEIDKVSFPVFEGRTFIEFDEWDDRSGEIIKIYTNKTQYGKTKTLKRRIVNTLPLDIKYRSLKLKTN